MKWVWVGKKNKLPTIAQSILISTRWGGVFLGQRQPLDKSFEAYIWWTPTQIFNADDILAWMPLPPAYPVRVVEPKSEKGKEGSRG